jgi:hypothetical protein
VSFKLRWSPAAQETFEQLRAQAERPRAQGNGRSKRRKSSKQEGLFKQVAKAIQHLSQDPRHRGLQTHEYTSLPHPFDTGGKVFEAYAQNKTPGAYRIFWCYGPERDELTIIAITPHP